MGLMSKYLKNMKQLIYAITFILFFTTPPLNAMLIAEEEEAPPTPSTSQMQPIAPSISVRDSILSRILIGCMHAPCASTVIADLFHTYDDVYRNIPEQRRPERE